jgi:hypothetical protein
MKRVALAGTARSDGECSNLRFVLRIVGVEDVLQGTHSWRILDTGLWLSRITLLPSLDRP